jgi:hypothetical protein
MEEYVPEYNKLLFRLSGIVSGCVEIETEPTDKYYSEIYEGRLKHLEIRSAKKMVLVTPDVYGQYAQFNINNTSDKALAYYTGKDTWKSGDDIKQWESTNKELTDSDFGKFIFKILN